MPSYFQLVLGAVSLSIFNFNTTMDKETISMKKTLMKAVGAGAAGRNRKFT